MSFDQIIEYIVVAVSAVLGWFLRELWSAVQELKKDISAMREEIPKGYVAKDDYKTDIGRVYDLLDKIYNKLDDKADKRIER